MKRWIAGFAAEHVTSAQEQRRQRDAWRAQGGPGKRFAMFLLSPDGYQYLDEQPPSPDGDFTVGMKRRQPGQPAQPAIPSDPPVEQWERPYQGQIDAMVLLADDKLERLKETERVVTGQLSGIFEKLTTERGRAIKKTFPGETVEKTIEHFGFQDGISQPIMIKQDLDEEIRKRGKSHWNPEARLSLALVREPGSEPDSTRRPRLGSFMVFRKLEQDVTAFQEAIARRRPLPASRRSRSGRWRWGGSRTASPCFPASP